MATPRPRLRAASRRVLVGVVVAGALATPALAASGPEPEGPEVHRRTIEVADAELSDGATAAIALPGDPELVAVTWSGTRSAAFQVRAGDGDRWGGWVELEGGDDDAPDANGPEGGSTRSAGPAYLGRDLTRLQLRVTEGSPGNVVVHAIDSDPVADDVVTPPPTARGELAADGGLEDLLGLGGSEGGAGANGVPNPPTMVTRAQWGADESWRDDSGGECDGTPDHTDGFELGTIHHTVSTNTYGPGDVAAILRGIYDFHVHQNGWCDIAYTFFVDRFGTIYEGRFGGAKRPIVGGHTSGFNTTSFGVAAIGDFTSAAVPPATYDALVDVLAFKMGYHGIDPTGSSTVVVGSNTSAKWAEGTSVTLKNLQGHGDSNKTSCPGTMLNNLLPQLRTDVAGEISAKGYQPAFTIDRLAAADRYATAATIARATFGSSGSAYLARGDSFPDALAASFPAGIANAPVLLATSTAVPAPTLSALRALGVSTVHLLGGTTALSPAVADALRGEGFTVDRVAGDDRFATAANVATAAGSGAVGTDDQGRRTAVLSSGRSFPDALAAGGIVFAKHFPQLLAEPDALPSTTAAALSALGVQHVVLTGGTAALSGAVEQQVQALGMTTERIAGATRWDTAVALADTAIDRYGVPAGHVDIATGTNFPDALTGGAHVGRTPGVLLLTEKEKVPAAVIGFLQRRAGAISGGDVLGGKTAVDSIVKVIVEETLRPNG